MISVDLEFQCEITVKVILNHFLSNWSLNLMINQCLLWLTIQGHSGWMNNKLCSSSCQKQFTVSRNWNERMAGEMHKEFGISKLGNLFSWNTYHLVQWPCDRINGLWIIPIRKHATKLWQPFHNRLCDFIVPSYSLTWQLDGFRLLNDLPGSNNRTHTD